MAKSYMQEFSDRGLMYVPKKEGKGTTNFVPPTEMQIPPPLAGDIMEVAYADGWNDCCDKFFNGGFDIPEMIVFTISKE